MIQLLTGLTVKLFGRVVSLFEKPTVILGITSDGKPAAMLVADDGAMQVSGGGQFKIPQFDTQAFAYVGSTNNVETITYSKDGAPVATLTFTYVNGGAADDDSVQSIAQS